MYKFRRQIASLILSVVLVSSVFFNYSYQVDAAASSAVSVGISELVSLWLEAMGYGSMGSDPFGGKAALQDFIEYLLDNSPDFRDLVEMYINSAFGVNLPVGWTSNAQIVVSSSGDSLLSTGSYTDELYDVVNYAVDSIYVSGNSFGVSYSVPSSGYSISDDPYHIFFNSGVGSWIDVLPDPVKRNEYFSSSIANGIIGQLHDTDIGINMISSYDMQVFRSSNNVSGRILYNYGNIFYSDSAIVQNRVFINKNSGSYSVETVPTAYQFYYELNTVTSSGSNTFTTGSSLDKLYLIGDLCFASSGFSTVLDNARSAAVDSIYLRNYPDGPSFYKDIISRYGIVAKIDSDFYFVIQYSGVTTDIEKLDLTDSIELTAASGTVSDLTNTTVNNFYYDLIDTFSNEGISLNPAIDYSDKFDSISHSLEDLIDIVQSKIDNGETITANSTESIANYNSYVTNVYQTLSETAPTPSLTDIKSAILSLPLSIADSIEATFTLSEAQKAELSASANVILAPVLWIPDFINSFSDFMDELLIQEVTPPKLYIYFGDASSSSIFKSSGTQVIFDCALYAPYKSLIDNFLTVFLWLMFLWRLFKHLPDILQGHSDNSLKEGD